MRILATIKATFKVMRIQWKSILLMYSIFPLLLCLFMGYTQKDLFRPDINIDKVNVNIVDKDNSEASKNFVKIFASSEMKRLFNVKKDSDYTITIPKDYEKNISSLKNADIDVTAKNDNTNNGDIIIKSIIKEYGKSLSESVIILGKINNMNVNDKQKLFADISEKINITVNKSAIKNKILKGQRTLTSNENEAASMSAYMIFMTILGFSAGHQLEKENGTLKRFLSTPITRASYFNLDLVVFFITSLGYGGIYIITMRLFGIAFKGTNPLIIILILLGQSMLAAAIGGFLIAFFNKKTATAIMMLLMYFEIIFGGAFIPSQTFTDSIFVTLRQYTPGTIITKAYKYCILFNSFNKIIWFVLTMLIVAAIVYLISIFKVKLRWEE